MNAEAIECDELQGVMGLHLFGIRPKGKGRREHRWSNWFEESDERKLHLKHEWRAARIHRVQMYFINYTEW